MRVVFKNVKAMSTLLGALRRSSETVNVVFSPSGMDVLTLNGIKTHVVRMRLAPNYFDHYSASTRIELGLHLGSLGTVLKQGGDAVAWTVSGDDFIVSVTSDGGNSHVVYSLRTITITEDTVQIPETIRVISMNVPTSVVRSWRASAQLTGAPVTFAFTPTAMCLETRGDIGNVEIKQNVGDRLKLVACRPNTVSVKTRISEAEMGTVEAIASCASSATFEYSVNENDDPMPLRVGCTLGDSSFLTAWIAPIMDDGI